MAVNSTSQWVNCGHLVLIAAMNAGPCRQYSDLKRACTSSIGVIQRPRKRISGLLLGRIDINIEVPWADYEKLLPGESSVSIRVWAEAARARQNGALPAPT